MPAKGIRILRVCERCGTQFSVTPGYLAHSPARYCSPLCVRGSLEHRYWAKVQKGPGCWIWTGRTAKGGYGYISRDGRDVVASRVGYELAYGPIPDGMFVLHNCPGGDNPTCQRPEHLWLGTIADNARDMVAKGRQNNRVGEAAHLARLTEAQVREIRARYVPGVVGLGRLGKEFGVTLQAIAAIVHRRSWKHVD